MAHDGSDTCQRGPVDILWVRGLAYVNIWQSHVQHQQMRGYLKYTAYVYVTLPLSLSIYLLISKVYSSYITLKFSVISRFGLKFKSINRIQEMT